MFPIQSMASIEFQGDSGGPLHIKKGIIHRIVGIGKHWKKFLDITVYNFNYLM